MFRKIADIRLTAEEVAAAFAAADAAHQARFFAALNAQIAAWGEDNWARQCEWIAKHLKDHPDRNQLVTRLATLLGKLQAEPAPAPATETAASSLDA